MTAMQGKTWLRQRPHVIAIIVLALLGSAGLASTFGGPLRRSALGKHKRLMSQGVPENLMRVNITATYADNFCKSSAPSNLTHSALDGWPNLPARQQHTQGAPDRLLCSALFKNLAHCCGSSCSVVIRRQP